VAGLIDVEPILVGQPLQQLLIRPLQRRADLGHDLGQHPPADCQTDDVAEELADGRVGGVANALEVGDQGGQVRPQQAPLDDDRRQHAVVDLVAARAVALVLAVFLDP
jgi:hypothetical protein